LVDMGCFVTYRILIRKVYKKRCRERALAADAFSIFLLLVNFITIVFVFEVSTSIKGFAFFSLNVNLPLAPIAVGVFFVFYLCLKVLPVKKSKFEKVAMIKKAIRTAEPVRRRSVVIYLIVSILLFASSFFLVLRKVWLGLV